MRVRYLNHLSAFIIALHLSTPPLPLYLLPQAHVKVTAVVCRTWLSPISPPLGSCQTGSQPAVSPPVVVIMTPFSLRTPTPGSAAGKGGWSETLLSTQRRGHCDYFPVVFTTEAAGRPFHDWAGNRSRPNVTRKLFKRCRLDTHGVQSRMFSQCLLHHVPCTNLKANCWPSLSSFFFSFLRLSSIKHELAGPRSSSSTLCSN